MVSMLYTGRRPVDWIPQAESKRYEKALETSFDSNTSHRPTINLFRVHNLSSIAAISLPTVCCSGWKPIAPPRDYYTVRPKTCMPDCDEGYKLPFLDDAGGGQAAETQVKSTLLSPSVAFNHESSFHQGNKKLDLEVFKPTEVSFFPSGDGKTLDYPLGTYQEVLRPSPSNYFSFKTYEGPGKPTKTILYGNLELARPKFTNDVKYYKPYKQNIKSDVKIFKPNFLENDLNFYQSKGNIFNEHCSLYKVSFKQDLYYQYIQYKAHMPELKEFTLCLWMRFHNHSHDHSLFSYSAKNNHKAIYMWVSNLNEPGLFNMKILGQTIFRLNYAIKLYKWYHTCQSWNGNTGEWQVWVNSHRIGRGFHNLLVNHPIPGGGIAISGQEHRHFGKGFREIPQFLKGTGGLEGEITMLQMYKISLTAGKAYNDHSHHHSHYTSTTEEPPELPTDEPSTTTHHPLLENGQLKPHVNVLELAEALKKGQLDTPELHPSSDHHHTFQNFYDKSLTHSYVALAPLALHGNSVNFVGFPTHAIFKRNDVSNTETKTDNENQEKDLLRIKVISNVTDQVQVEKIQFSNKHNDTDTDEKSAMVLSHQSEVIMNDKSGENMRELYSGEDPTEEKPKAPKVRSRKRLRRHNSQRSFRVTGNRTKRITTGEMRPTYFTYGVKKRPNVMKSISRKTPGYEGKEASKRHVVFKDSYLNFGSVGLTGQEVFPALGVPLTGISYDQFSHFGQDISDLHEGGEQNTEDSLLHDEGSDTKIKKEIELAEGEVRRIMELCSGCHLDPFRKVAVISWRSTPKKIYSGSLFLKAKSECEHF